MFDLIRPDREGPRRDVIAGDSLSVESPDKPMGLISITFKPFSSIAAGNGVASFQIARLA